MIQWLYPRTFIRSNLQNLNTMSKAKGCVLFTDFGWYSNHFDIIC